MQRILRRSWAKNQAIEQIIPIVDKDESSRAREEAIEAKVKELEFELRAKTIKIQDLERTHMVETDKLQVENKELQGIVESRSSSFCLQLIHHPFFVEH